MSRPSGLLLLLDVTTSPVPAKALTLVRRDRMDSHRDSPRSHCRGHCRTRSPCPSSLMTDDIVPSIRSMMLAEVASLFATNRSTEWEHHGYADCLWRPPTYGNLMVPALAKTGSRSCDPAVPVTFRLNNYHCTIYHCTCIVSSGLHRRAAAPSTPR